MDLRKLKSGSDVRGVAVGEEAVLTADVARELGKAFARWLAAKTAKPVEQISIAVIYNNICNLSISNTWQKHTNNQNYRNCLILSHIKFIPS